MKVTVSVNAFHGDKATFFNKAVHVAGCTYTQGWYKNHATTQQWGGLSPNALFYNGVSWINLYNPPPKGSQYIILAHQFMTTTLNIQKGASVPPAVQAAYDAAKTYFTTSGGTIDPNWATILDEYNNGLAANGPAHCE